MGSHFDRARKIRVVQDACYEAGYSAGQSGKDKQVPDGVVWPGWWLNGWMDAAEDQMAKAPGKPKE